MRKWRLRLTVIFTLRWRGNPAFLAFVFFTLTLSRIARPTDGLLLESRFLCSYQTASANTTPIVTFRAATTRVITRLQFQVLLVAVAVDATNVGIGSVTVWLGPASSTGAAHGTGSAALFKVVTGIDGRCLRRGLH